MALSKQITRCSFDIFQSDGVTSQSGYPKQVEVFSGSFVWRPYYLSGQPFDQALSGKLRTQLGGYRLEVTLNWEKLQNTANLLNIVNDARVTTFRPRIAFAQNVSATTTNYNVVLSDVSWQTSLESTVVRQPLSVTFVGQDVLDEIPDDFTL